MSNFIWCIYIIVLFKYIVILIKINKQTKIYTQITYILKNNIIKKMSMGKIQDRIKKMKQAIQSQARQRASNIIDRAQQQADIQRNNIIKHQKQKIDEQYHKLSKTQKIRAKIQKSSTVNKQRILKMQERYKLVEQLKSQLKQKLKQIMVNQNKCKQINQKLIVQGMLRMMERNVSVESLPSQQNMIKSLFGACQAQFTQILRIQTGKDSQVVLSLSQYRLENKYKSIIGGIFLRSQDGLIVCDNSLDARVQLIFQHMLPDIRNMLFPPKLLSQQKLVKKH